MAMRATLGGKSKRKTRLPFRGACVTTWGKAWVGRRGRQSAQEGERLQVQVGGGAGAQWGLTAHGPAQRAGRCSSLFT